MLIRPCREDGGATYHNRYSTYDFVSAIHFQFQVTASADQHRVPMQVRGQEGDFWKGQVDFTPPEFYPFGKHREQDLINRQFMTKTAEMPQWITFDLGLEFIERNKDADNWFLQLETFDPHEPFFTQQVSENMH